MPMACGVGGHSPWTVVHSACATPRSAGAKGRLRGLRLLPDLLDAAEDPGRDVPRHGPALRTHGGERIPVEIVERRRSAVGLDLHQIIAARVKDDGDDLVPV